MQGRGGEGAIGKGGTLLESDTVAEEEQRDRLSGTMNACDRGMSQRGGSKETASITTPHPSIAHAQDDKEHSYLVPLHRFLHRVLSLVPVA